MAERDFDVIVWGATGFTGKLCAEYLLKNYGLGNGVKWALGGRNKGRLEAVKSTLSSINSAAKSLELVVGDSQDAPSLLAMAKRTKVVLTTVGPYLKYGTPLVEACIEAKTDCVDLTGETPWVKILIDRFHARAEERGVKIVNCCGFDSVPSDLGCLMMINHLKNEYGEETKSVKYALGKSQGGASGGTLDSVLTIIDNLSLKDMKQLGDPYLLNPPDSSKGSDGADQVGPVFDKEAQVWTAPFVMANTNTRVVRRSVGLIRGLSVARNVFSYTETHRMGKGPVGFIAACFLSAIYPVMMFLFYFRLTRWLVWKLLRLPKPGEGITREQIEKGFYQVHLVAESTTGRKVKGRVLGKQDPGYGDTSRMLVESALCLAIDKAELKKDSMLRSGGILTPASAMGVALIQRLRAAGTEYVAGG